MAFFQNEDGPEDVCGGQSNVDCLKPWKPEPCNAVPVPAFIRELAMRVKADAVANPLIQRLRSAGVAL